MASAWKSSTIDVLLSPKDTSENAVWFISVSALLVSDIHFFHSVMQSDEFEQQNAKTISPQQTIETAVT